ncbi:MAG: Mu transposase C-terminal domain-containing protein [Sedimenticola sp.]
MQGQTPLQRYQQDLPRIRTLGQRAARLNEIFYHRLPRKVRKDGTVAYQGQRFEVPYELVGRQVRLVVDPHTEQAISVEDGEGKALGEATALDVIANNRRQRHKPASPASPAAPVPNSKGTNLVELAYQQHHAIGDVPTTSTDAKQAIRTETEKDEE